MYCIDTEIDPVGRLDHIKPDMGEVNVAYHNNITPSTFSRNHMRAHTLL
jgi:hypothetical protein